MSRDNLLPAPQPQAAPQRRHSRGRPHRAADGRPRGELARRSGRGRPVRQPAGPQPCRPAHPPPPRRLLLLHGHRAGVRPDHPAQIPHPVRTVDRVRVASSGASTPPGPWARTSGRRRSLASMAAVHLLRLRAGRGHLGDPDLGPGELPPVGALIPLTRRFSPNDQQSSAHCPHPAPSTTTPTPQQNKPNYPAQPPATARTPKREPRRTTTRELPLQGHLCPRRVPGARSCPRPDRARRSRPPRARWSASRTAGSSSPSRPWTCSRRPPRRGAWWATGPRWSRCARWRTTRC